MSDDRPRLTPEEADARFAALVAEHRRETGGPRRPSGPRGRLVPGSPRTLAEGHANLAMMLVYVVGVIAGSIWHAKPGVAILLGVLVCAVRWGYARFSRPAAG